MEQKEEKQKKVVKRKRKKKQKTFYTVLGIIADIIIYPVIIISVIASFSMLLTNRSSELPSVFGVSVVKIMTGSMTTAGFDVGDIVLVKETDTTTLKEGDIVAFYKFKDTVDSPYYSQFIPQDKFESVYNGVSEGQTVKGRTSADKLKGSRIYFHRIKNVYVLPYDGSIFYETAGSANDNLSDGFIRSDFIVGKYVETPVIVRESLKFCSSRWGMITLVILPLSILVLLECLSIVEQLNEMIIENKVFKREEPFDCEESIKANIGENMELYRQIFFYATTKDELKEDCRKFLWGHLEEEKLTKEEIELKQNVNKSIEIYKTDQNQYYNYWFNNLKSKRQKNKLEKLVNQYKVEEIIKNKGVKVGKKD